VSGWVVVRALGVVAHSGGSPVQVSTWTSSAIIGVLLGSQVYNSLKIYTIFVN